MRLSGKISPTNKKHLILLISGLSGIIVGILLLFRSVNELIIGLLFNWLNYALKYYWVDRLQVLGFLLLVMGQILTGWFFLINKKKNIPNNILRKFRFSIESFRIRIGKYLSLNNRGDKKKWGCFKLNLNAFDIFILIVFFLVAIFFYHNPCQTTRTYVELSGDAATYASVTAAFDQPESFMNDSVYGDRNIYKIYFTVQIPVIRLINHFLQNFSLSFMVLIIAHIFIQLSGYFFLGRLLFRDRFWALFLSLVMFIPIALDLERWGVWLPLPRFMYKSLLPFLWMLVFLWKDQQKKWLWLTILTAILCYVHLLDGLVWGLCIWSLYWFFAPKHWSIGKRLITNFSLGVLFLLIVAPLILFLYLPGSKPVNAEGYRLQMYILNTFYPNNLAEVPDIAWKFLKIIISNGVFPLAVVAILGLRFFKTDRSILNLMIIWMFTIIIYSLVIPFFIRIFEKLFQIAPLEIVFTRELHYTYPLLLLLMVWLLVEINHRAKSKWLGYSILFFALSWLAIYGISQRDVLKNHWQKIEFLFLKSNSFCQTNEFKVQALDYIKENTAPGSTFLTYSWKNFQSSEFNEIRYDALRPLVFNYKDNMYFIYKDSEKLKKWNDIYWTLYKITENFPHACDRLSGLIDLQKNLNANYLFIDSDGNKLKNCAEGINLVNQTGNYYLFTSNNPH